MRYLTLYLLIIITTYLTKSANAEYIAQIDIQQEGGINSVFIKLFENDAPLTVQNFRNYVGAGAYDSSFIHRMVINPPPPLGNGEPFILQGGGFTFDPVLNDGSFSFFTGGLLSIPENMPPVVNEFRRSNLRGTLAMAKLSGDPDSATNQWFVNLADNSANLDFQNGGFTVFAEVLGTGMDVIDAIVNQADITNRADVHSAFSSLPLVNFVSGSVSDSNLIVIKSIAEVLSISPDINYGVVTSGTNVQPETVIRNISTNPVLIGDVASQNSLSAPFRIVSDKCSNKVLLPGERCAFISLFSPVSSGVFNDSFDVTLPELGINYEINLSGQGAAEVTEADITSTFSSVDFETLDVLFSADDSPYISQLVLSNFGSETLDLFSIVLSSDSNSGLSLGGDCLEISKLTPNGFCVLNILYHPLVVGRQSATVIIESSDPDESRFEIPVFAVSLGESDGVDVSIENTAPNNGDGNNDDILDSRQSNVVSLPDLDGMYLTYVTTLGRAFSDVAIVNQSAFDPTSNNVNLSSGVHEFTLENIPADAVVDVGILLPVNVMPSEYYVYGATPDNLEPHWYAFRSNGETGIKFIGVAKITSPTGNVIDRYVMSVSLKNGGRGDSNGAQNNTIVVKAALSYDISDDNGGGFSFFSLLFAVLSIVFYRSFKLVK